MALMIADRSPMLEQRTKTEISIDQINGFADNYGIINDYLGNERLRSYKTESAYDVFLQNKLNDLFISLSNETAHSSISMDVISNSNFKKIVQYGEVIAPAIFISLSRKPSILIWALNQIFNMRISEKSLSIEQATTAWVKWGRAKRMI